MSSHPGFVKTHPTARAFSSTWWGAIGRGMSSAGYGDIIRTVWDFTKDDNKYQL
jgi:hypothetical protein